MQDSLEGRRSNARALSRRLANDEFCTLPRSEFLDEGSWPDILLGGDQHMASGLDTLSFKGQQNILVVNGPPRFERELSRLKAVVIHRSSNAMKEVSYSSEFVPKKRAVDALAEAVAAKSSDDAMEAHSRRRKDQRRTTVRRPGLVARQRPFVLCLVVPILWLTAVARADTAQDQIVGKWRGSSTCMNREAAPACTDEQVVYRIKGTPGKTDKVTVEADKIVDGKAVPMGVLEFTYDPGDGSWTSEVQTPRFHQLWRLAVRGALITGTLSLLPSKTVVRNLELHKEK